MTTPDYLKCPGSDPVSTALPEFFPCPECETDIEIWTDGSGGKCPSCNTYFKKGNVEILNMTGLLCQDMGSMCQNFLKPPVGI